MRVIPHDRNRGKGAALRTGFAAASAEYVIVQDADLEYDPAEYGTMLEPLETRRRRRRVRLAVPVGPAAPRPVLLALARQPRADAAVEHVHRPQPHRHGDVLQGVPPRGARSRSSCEEDRFGFEPEITAKVAGGGWRIYEVGISYAGRTYAEGKKIGWRDGVRALVCIVRYSPRGASGVAQPAPRRAGERRRGGPSG